MLCTNFTSDASFPSSLKNSFLPYLFVAPYIKHYSMIATKSKKAQRESANYVCVRVCALCVNVCGGVVCIWVV